MLAPIPKNTTAAVDFLPPSAGDPLAAAPGAGDPVALVVAGEAEADELEGPGVVDLVAAAEAGP